jgi:hypothetical protein
MNTPFDLSINPYDCLGIPRNCIDEKILKNAYKAKSLVLNPENTNGLTKTEFSNLNKSYLYLKMLITRNKSQNTLIPQSSSRPVLNVLPTPFVQDRIYPQQETKRQEFELPVNTLSRSDLPKRSFVSNTNFEADSQLPRTITQNRFREAPLSLVSSIGTIERFPMNKNTGYLDRLQKSDINIQRKDPGRGSRVKTHLGISSTISNDTFNEHEALEEMKKYRPTSTNYNDLLKFNDNIDSNNPMNDFTIDAWSSSFDQTANIVSDSTTMFVYDDIRNDNDIPNLFGEHDERQYETDMVSNRHLGSYMQSRSKISTTSTKGSKLNNSQFKQRMDSLEQEHLQNLEREAQEKKRIIDEHFKFPNY